VDFNKVRKGTKKILGVQKSLCKGPGRPICLQRRDIGKLACDVNQERKAGACTDRPQEGVLSLLYKS
jgi:hypothetical protein